MAFLPNLLCSRFPCLQDVARGYLRPLLAHDWDRASLLNFRAFSIPPAYDYSVLTAPVLLVQASGSGGWAWARSLWHCLAGSGSGRPQATWKALCCSD